MRAASWLAPLYRLLALNWRWLPGQRAVLERATMVVAIVIIPLAVPVLEALLMGQYAPAFWLFIAAGGMLPLLIVGIPRTRTVNGIVFASALVVAAMWLKRLLIVVPAVSHPLISGTWGAFQPTWVPLVVTIAAACSIPLALMIFFKLVPILSIYEMEEIALPPTRTNKPGQLVLSATFVGPNG